MRNKTVRGDLSKSMLSYIRTELVKNNNLLLGLIAMESISEYITVDNYLNQESSTRFGSFFGFFKKDPKKDVYLKLLFLSLRLWYESGYVHCDLHTNNAMIRYDNGIKDIELIDFGRKEGTGIPIDPNYVEIMRKYGQLTEDEINDAVYKIITKESSYNYEKFESYTSNIDYYFRENGVKSFELLMALFKDFSKSYFRNEKLQTDMNEAAACYHIISPTPVKLNDLLSEEDRREANHREEERQNREKERQNQEEAAKARRERRQAMHRRREEQRRRQEEKEEEKEEKEEKVKEAEKLKNAIEEQNDRHITSVLEFGHLMGGRRKKRTCNKKRRLNKSIKRHKK
jgi:predicted unusual protein kinase regulating ubiquinone biosynthesis (AarF/ABC1/UbiB family)